MQIDFSAAFDNVNHRDIQNRLCSVGIIDSVMSILTHFLSNRSHHVMVDSCPSKLVYAVSGVRMAVFRACYCSFCTLRSFFPLLKLS